MQVDEEAMYSMQNNLYIQVERRRHVFTCYAEQSTCKCMKDMYSMRNNLHASG